MLGEMHHTNPRVNNGEKMEELEGGLWRLMHKPQQHKKCCSLVLEDEKQIGRMSLPPELRVGAWEGCYLCTLQRTSKDHRHPWKRQCWPICCSKITDRHSVYEVVRGLRVSQGTLSWFCCFERRKICEVPKSYPWKTMMIWWSILISQTLWLLELNSVNSGT